MIKRVILTGLVVTSILASSPAEAQLTVSGRLSAEDTDTDGKPLEESHAAFLRSGSIDYQTGRWRFGGNFTQGDSSNESFIFGAGTEYSRTWKELSIGFTISPGVEAIGGVRADEIELVENFFSSATLLKAEQTLPFAGLRYHKQPRRVGVDLSAVFFAGTSDVTLFDSIESSDEATGVRLQIALPIRIGESGSKLSPGYDYETFDLGGGVKQQSTRFFLQYSYTFGK